MPTSVSKRDRTRKGELQRLLGEHGTVLSRVEKGTIDRPAQGWYAQLRDDTEIFLGDTTMLAALKIRELVPDTRTARA